MLELRQLANDNVHDVLDKVFGFVPEGAIHAKPAFDQWAVEIIQPAPTLLVGTMTQPLQKADGSLQGEGSQVKRSWLGSESPRILTAAIIGSTRIHVNEPGGRANLFRYFPSLAMYHALRGNISESNRHDLVRARSISETSPSG